MQDQSLAALSLNVGTVLQDPDAQFVALTAGEDVPLHWKTAPWLRVRCTPELKSGPSV